MLLIFIFSGSYGASSGGVSERVVASVRPYLPSLSDQIIKIVVRKAAHLFMYGVLGALLANLLRSYKLPAKAVLGYSLLVAGLYASFDEVHQYFVGGRSSSPRDVAIDVTGAAIGIFLFYAIIKLNYRLRAEGIQNV